MYNKIIFFVDTKKGEKKHFKSKFLQFIKRTSIFTHYIKKSRRSTSKYIFYKTLLVVKHPYCLLKRRLCYFVKGEMLAIGAPVKLLIYVSKDSFSYIIFAEKQSSECILYEK